MCGTWIALQDIAEDSGVLVIYPGSHRAQRIYAKDIAQGKINENPELFDSIIYPLWGEIAAKYRPKVCRPKKGSVIIWHENLLHGGTERMNQNLERRSMVIHSFADGACVYYDSTGSVGHVEPITVTN
jgi:ectoine hydroxylase-related dioxygenase (phytanoyl-CoA dioxygenase family)